MRWNFHSAVRATVFRLAFSAGLLLMVLALAALAGPRIRLAPKFTPGETLRYRIETRTTSTGNTTAPIDNPEGGSQFKQTVNLLVRLDVLDVPPGAAPSPGAVRFRATYEKSGSESETDAFDLQAPTLDERFARLEGHSIEFTLEPGGQLTGVRGLDEIYPGSSENEPALSWANALSLGAGFPREGIAIGQRWRSERPVTNSPLAGLLWRTESTYLRDEPCLRSGGPGDLANPPGTNHDMCAVVLTRFDIHRRGSAGSDATPDDYRRNGLRTSGTWTASGESLDSVALSSGLLVSSTQNSAQKMDYRITSASTGSAIHKVGQVQTQSIVTLVPGNL